MKQILRNIIVGIVSSVLIMGLIFYFFLFLNPLRIYEVNTLRWIPVLIALISFYVSGFINKDTPLKFLPFLFLPLVIFKLFNYAYFPFILVLLLAGAIALLAARSPMRFKYYKLAWIGTLGFFLFFLFSQPLILMKKNFTYGKTGALINANEVWNFNGEEIVTLPTHILFDKNNSEFDISAIKGEMHLLTFWATWCAPCLKEKPDLEGYKREFEDQIKFIDVSFDSDRQKWIQYIDKEQVGGTQLVSGNLQITSRAFEFNGIPMYILVSSDGSYRKYHSFEVVKNVINEVLADKRTEVLSQ